MGLKGLLDRNEEPSDVESEREGLRRQRIEGAAELEALKRTLAERVAFVQQRERELAEAQARVDKHEQRLVSGDGRVSRLDSVRFRLAEAKATRAALDARANELARREAAVAAKEQGHSSQAPQLDERERELAARADELDQRETILAEREGALEAGNDKVQLPVAAPPERANATDEVERIEEKLAELRDAEQAFARTHAELAKRSDALAEQEEALAKRERGLAAKEAPPVGLDVLEARIRRLEQGGRRREREPQTFSAGLRTLQERGLRGGPTPDEPLH
jgi:chromosome segregation ATPase